MRHLTKGRVRVLVGLLIARALVGASDVAAFLITGTFIDAAEAELRSGRVHEQQPSRSLLPLTFERSAC